MNKSAQANSWIYSAITSVFYFSKDAYADMTKDWKYNNNKELMIIPDAVHTDLYDNLNVIPFDKIESFMREYLK